MRTVVIASGNPVKIQAVAAGFNRLFPGETFSFEGLDLPSGVSDQPYGDQETLTGAVNRARAAQKQRPQAHFWVGVEGGVAGSGGELMAFAWVVILDERRAGRSRTGVFFLPPEVARLVHAGMELGEADDQVFNRSDSKRQEGAIGILTAGALDRRSFYEQAVILALLPFRNPQLYPANGALFHPPGE